MCQLADNQLLSSGIHSYMNSELSTDGLTISDKGELHQSGGQRSVKTRSFRAAAWIVASFFVGRVLRLGGNVVVAWLLFPEAFGLMTLVAAVMHGLKLISDAGLHGSVVYHRDGEQETYLNTVWTIQIARGLGICIVATVLGWPLSILYSEPRIFPLLGALGVGGAIEGFSSTSIYSHSRRIEVGRLTLLELAVTICTTLSTILWALYYPSVWALVAGALTGSIVRVAGSHFWLMGHRHSLCWDRASRRSILSFGKWIVVSSTTYFLANRLGRLLLAKLASMASLGVYGIAFAFAAVPTAIIERLGNNVLQPALAESRRSGAAAYVSKFFLAREAILVIGLFGALAVAGVSPILFGELYDTRYGDASWMGQLLAIGVWFDVLSGTATKALLANGHSRPVALAQLINACVATMASVSLYLYVGMSGFIVGGLAGILSGHLVNNLYLMWDGTTIAMQDLAYSWRFLVCYGTVVAGPYYTADHVSRIDSLWINASFAILGLVLAAALTFAGWWRIGVALRSTSEITSSRVAG